MIDIMELEKSSNITTNVFIMVKNIMSLITILRNVYDHSAKNCGSFDEVLNRYKSNRNEFIELTNVLYNWQMMLFALESAYYDIPVRFVKNINLESGIGEIRGFSKDILRIIKEIHPINSIHNDNGRRMWDYNDNLILPEWY